MLAIVMRLLGYRKETERVKKKGLRILAAAAVLTFGCLTMNAYAAEGWALSNNIWTVSYTHLTLPTTERV